MNEFMIPVKIEINYPHWIDCLKFLRNQERPPEYPWVTEDMVSRSLFQSFLLLYDYCAGEKVSGVNEWLKSMYTPQPIDISTDFIYEVMKNTGVIKKLDFGYSKRLHYFHIPKQEDSKTFLNEKHTKSILNTGILHNPYIMSWSLFEKIRMARTFEVVQEEGKSMFKQTSDLNHAMFGAA